MGKRDRYRDHPDPEHRRWGRTYRSFPGVEECVRLILDGKAKGTWAEIIVSELAENASEHLAELIAAFRAHPSDQVALHVMMALEIAAIPESVRFLSEVLNEGEPVFSDYARQTLTDIDTPEARKALWNAKDIRP